jgi:hypothetical protein
VTNLHSQSRHNEKYVNIKTIYLHLLHNKTDWLLETNARETTSLPNTKASDTPFNAQDGQLQTLLPTRSTSQLRMNPNPYYLSHTCLAEFALGQWNNRLMANEA